VSPAEADLHAGRGRPPIVFEQAERSPLRQTEDVEVEIPFDFSKIAPSKLPDVG
jgi:hypothetical protein